MRRNKVPVYSRHAESLADRPLRYMTETQAMELVSERKAKRVSQKGAPLKIQLLQLERDERPSPACISYSEVLANVGLSVRSGGNISPQRQKDVQAKVAAFAVPSFADRLVSTPA